MEFFGIPDRGIFYFGLDRKILKIPKSRESGFKNPEIPGLGIWKSQNPRARDLFFRDIPGIWDFFWVAGFLSPEFGIFI